MANLVLKLVLTPLLVGGASLAGRRWGHTISGWLIALPLTSGPIVFFLALSQGLPFAAATAVGVLAGALSPIAFCLTYSWLAARWGWLRALGAGCLVFAAATALLRPLPLSWGLVYPVVLLALAGALRLMPRPGASEAAPARLPAWDIPARMLVATTLVVGLTAAAPALGPQLTGLLAPFPIFGSTLAIFAQNFQGPRAAVNVLRGLLHGLFAFTSFFAVVAALLEPAGLAAAFGAGLAVALLVQGVTLWRMRRPTYLK